MNDIDNFIAKLEPSQAEIAKALRRLIKTSFPELEEIYSWKMPVYVINDVKVAYLQVGKQGINLGFNYGSKLNEKKGFFEGGGKLMRHIHVTNVSEIDESYFKDLLEQAIKQTGKT